MIIETHPQNPNPRKIQHAVDILNKDGVIAYPTDTLFGLGCDVRSIKALKRISMICRKEKILTFSFLCNGFSQANEYAQISKNAFKIMKRLLPGPYTFILPATSLVPKKIVPKRKTVGIRIPDNKVCQDIIESIGAPIANTSIDFIDAEFTRDAYSIEAMIGNRIDAVIDSGTCDIIPSTIIDLTDDTPVIIREGKGKFTL